MNWASAGVVELLQGCIDGQGPAWAQFWSRYHKVIASTVVKTCRECGGAPRETADELIQETYLKLVENNYRILRDFKTTRPDSIYGLLQAIAYSTSVDRFRAAKAQKRWPGAGPIPLDDLRGLSNGASHDLDKAVLLAEIAAHLRAQRPRDRAIFLLHYQQGMSARAISQLPWVDLKPGGVESAILRIMKDLREKFQSRV